MLDACDGIDLHIRYCRKVLSLIVANFSWVERLGWMIKSSNAIAITATAAIATAIYGRALRTRDFSIGVTFDKTWNTLFSI